MNPKTPGQIAFEAAPPHKLQWSLATDKAEWEMIAAAVIAHHEAQKQPQPKFRVGDRVKTNFGSTGVIDRISKDGWHFIGFLCYRDYSLQPAPWTLPAPPAGREWHRDDWTADMLPDGWRPLLMGEIVGNRDEVYSVATDAWDLSQNCGWKMGATLRYRTRRPLPPTHEITIELPQLTLTSGRLSLAAI